MAITVGPLVDAPPSGKRGEFADGTGDGLEKSDCEDCVLKRVVVNGTCFKGSSKTSEKSSAGAEPDAFEEASDEPIFPCSSRSLSGPPDDRRLPGEADFEGGAVKSCSTGACEDVDPEWKPVEPPAPGAAPADD